ncbi:hypothetical protein [Noviherbaspirillum pedocola]|uniref:Uncharacterized protein n=1 Tax=Noviherbaspirillum pedocola TaxID=2801341 RepID=A0A934SQR8_9BURK|nr:hypothetical protein [Noviherbaspirillum pedocola]MBK4733744.1 hypothetical protein [Noviherbaspirillum pedocola]
MATSIGAASAAGSHVNSAQGGGSPPTSAVPQEKPSLGYKPSFIFNTAHGVGEVANASIPLPLPLVNSSQMPMPKGSEPGVSSKKPAPGFFEEISSSSEDEAPIKSNSGAKNSGKQADLEKKRRTPSIIAEANPGLAGLGDAEFAASEDNSSSEEHEKAEKTVPDPISGATKKEALPEEIEAAIDSVLADQNISNERNSSVPSSSTNGDSHSGGPAKKTNAKKLASSSATPKKDESASRSSQDEPPQPVSPSTPQSLKPDSSKRTKPASATITPAVLPATPAPSSSTTPPSSARSPKLDKFTSIRPKKAEAKTEVEIDGKQPPEPEKRTKLKKSPRSERPERAKRRSQRMAALTLQPRYVPDTGDRDVPTSSQASLEQCRGLLQLLEAGCDKELRWQLLGALVEMAFALPKKSRAEVLERSWRCARALPDAQLRQWAHQVLSRYYKAKGADDDDSSEESSAASCHQAMEEFTALCRDVKGATTRKAWNELAAKIAGSRLDVQAQLEATAVAIDSFKSMKDKAAIRDAMSALKKKLGAKLLVLAFFQSSACPGAKSLRGEIQHTASAVLRGILAGEPRAIEDFKSLLSLDIIADGIEEALHGCMRELATDLMARQPGNASPAPANTGDVRSATATSNAPTDATTATPQPVSAPETILDIVRELLLLEGQSGVPGATWLPDRSICLLLSVLELEHDAALRAIDDVAYDNATSFIHGVCASTLTPLSCKILLEDMVPDQDNKPTLPLLQHLMVSGNIHVAREYLGKLDASDMRKSDLNRLLRRIDGSGPSAMELAIILGRDDNIREFIDIVAGLGKLGADEKLALLEAKRNDGTPGLLCAIQSDSTKMEASVYAYMTGLLQFDEKHIRDVIGMLSAPNKDGNSPFRLALMKDDASLVYSMVRAICEDKTLAPDEKAALLSGQTSVADANVDYREKGLTAYYLAVKAIYLKKFPNDGIPKSKAADNGKITYFTSTPVSFEKPFDRVDADAKLQWDKARDESLFAMMSRFTESERKECKQLGRRLVRQEREKATSAFHAALRNGKAQSVTGYIRAMIEYAVTGSHIRPISFILAEDASGNPALFNAMENDEFRAVGAYVEAVLSSDLQIEDKYALLKPYGEDGYTPLQIAMASGSRRAMSAYVASVLDSSLSDDQKQQLLLSIGKNGKSARQMLDDLLQRKPNMDRASLQQFDAMITESNLGGLIKRFLIHDYGNKGGVKKT